MTPTNAPAVPAIESMPLWPSVVVIIPFYNGADFIERSVRSVFEQSVPAAEVIVVNDGSRPEERAALDGLATRYPFRILDKENGGQGSARNAGVAASTSDFICFLDQDDFYLPNHIETLASSIPQDDRLFGFVYADLYEADADGNVIRTGVVKEHATHPKRNINDLLRHDMFVLPSATLISRKAFEAVGGFDSQFMGFEDDDLFLRVFRKGYSNYFVDKAVTVWCIHTASTSFGIRMIRSRLPRASIPAVLRQPCDRVDQERRPVPRGNDRDPLRVRRDGARQPLCRPQEKAATAGHAVSAEAQFPRHGAPGRGDHAAAGCAQLAKALFLSSSAP